MKLTGGICRFRDPFLTLSFRLFDRALTKTYPLEWARTRAWHRTEIKDFELTMCDVRATWGILGESRVQVDFPQGHLPDGKKCFALLPRTVYLV